MKSLMKSTLCLIAVFFFTTTYAANVVDNFKGSVEIKTVCPDETTEIKLNFASIEDFNVFDEDILENIEEECTVSISVTVSVGVGSTYVSVTMTAEGIPCSEVKAKIAELKEAALAAIG